MVLSAPERITRLIEVAAALSKTMTPEQVADVVTTKGLAALGARGGALLRLDDEAGDYVLHRCTDGEPRSVLRLPLAADLPIAVCARTGRAISAGAESMCLPLLIRGHAIGAIALEFGPEAPLGPEALAFREATVEQCSQALERARLYALERVRREELEHSNRMKDDFLGIVSHELRTPLSAILGWARMLKRGMITSPRARERALEAIERNASLQARLVDDLLDVSRIVSGKLSFDMTAVDLAAIIEAAIDSVRPSLLSKGLEIGTTLDDQRATVLGDARRLQQVVWNLLTNAIKFTPAGGRIEIVLERGERTASVSVRDTGIGIPADVLPRIFERFKQADGTATRMYGGLGLGLSIVRHVVESHGGRAEARSDGEGRGAEMVIELPIADADVPSSARTGEAEAERARLEGARVLLVDPDDESRELLATVLETEGAELRAIARAHEALETFGSWRPDVIVADVAAHEEEGYAFLREVRALSPQAGGRTPAVALTGLARATDRARTLGAGFQTHVSRLVDPRELVQAIARLWPPGRSEEGETGRG
jgi:signal transduction histidine kinase/ActR/RegA family two-component response regulator